MSQIWYAMTHRQSYMGLTHFKTQSRENCWWWKLFYTNATAVSHIKSEWIDVIKNITCHFPINNCLIYVSKIVLLSKYWI